MKKTLWLAVCTLALLFGSTRIGAAEDTLEKVKRTGVLILGANDDAIPVAYVWDGEHVGYNVALCRRVAEAVRRRLGLAELRVLTVNVMQATRMAMLNNGTIDIACGHNPVNATSLTQARLSHATLVTQMRAMARQDRSGLKFNDIGGLKIGTTVGGQALGRLRAHLRQHALQVTPAVGRTAAEVWSLLEGGQADLILLPDVYLLAQRARTAAPERFALLDDALGSDTIALMFRSGDDPLAEVANEVISGLMRSGEMLRLYQVWFEAVIPGLERGLGLPASEATRKLFANPGSEMLAL